MFISPPRRTDQHYVATIGEKKNGAIGMGTVRWRWKDDNGKDHNMNVEDVLFSPTIPSQHPQRHYSCDTTQR